MGPFVYFIQAGDGPIKIGVAEKPEQRLRELQTAHFEELQLLLAIAGGYAREAELHVHFAEHRLRGEWFAPARELRDFVDALRRVADMPPPSMEPLEIPDPVEEICDDCGWPLSGELAERGIYRCWKCLSEEVPERVAA